MNVPENTPSTFYEAVLTIYVYFSADPDSVGTLDRYLPPFYENDIKNGIMTRDDAKESPENYGNLRVRVTGFSDYFVKLRESIQDDIIERTTHKC